MSSKKFRISKDEVAAYCKKTPLTAMLCEGPACKMGDYFDCWKELDLDKEGYFTGEKKGISVFPN